MTAVEDWNKLKVVDLKAELKQRGLSVAGRKEELIQRLADDDQGISSGQEAATDSAEANNEEQADANGATADIDMGEEEVLQAEVTEPAQEQKIEAEAVVDAADAAVPAVATEEPAAEEPSSHPTQDLPSPAAGAVAATVAAASPVSATGDAFQDEQKRKRDSVSPPPPISMDIDDGSVPSKRQRVDEELADEPAAIDADIDMADTAADNFVEDTAGVASSSPAAIHPPTNALYIANLMRPLRPMLLDRCMADLAGSKDAVVQSFLDPIKTHAFVVFRDADAAARVRVNLHGRIWPEESSRRPLWIDFVPADLISGWIDEEKSDRGFFNNTGRGGGANSRFDAVKRWELIYSESDTIDGEGQVVTTLRQIGSSTPEIPGKILFDSSMLPGQSNQRGVSPPPFDAPRGPRGKDGDQDMVDGPHDQPRRRRGRGGGVLEDDIRTTRTSPPLDYQVVHPDLVRRRQENILSHRVDSANGNGGQRSPSRSRSRSRDPRGGPVQSEYTKTHNRYSFDAGFELVDRGPEQFDGIRPPHRERERRQQRGRGGLGGGGFGSRLGGGGPPTGPSAPGGPGGSGLGLRRRRKRGGRDRRRGYDDYRPGRDSRDGRDGRDGRDARGGSRDRRGDRRDGGDGRGDGRRDDQRDWRDYRGERKERDGGHRGGRDEREGRLGAYDARW